MRQACADYRALQSELRAGRESYKAMLGRFRDVVSLLAGARKAGLI
jgi:uncharacterized protein involved in exopolysaccharide biosynthesis